MKIYKVIIALCSPLLLVAQDANTLDIEAKFEQSTKEMEAKFASFSQDIESEYAALEEKINREYSQFEDHINSKWGENENNFNQEYVWVEYNDEYDGRTIVDYENETSEIELLVSESELADSAALKQRLALSVEQLLESKGKNSDYNSQYIEQGTVTETPILDGVVDLTKYDIHTDDSRATVVQTNEAKAEEKAEKRGDSLISEQIAKMEVPIIVEEVPLPSQPQEKANEASKSTNIAMKIVEKEPLKISKVETKSGTMNIVKISPNLVSGLKYKKAKQFEPIVDKYSLKYKIDKSLIFGIIETESMFDTKASSPANAHGLMQIVPRTAGIDSYRLVYGQERLLNQSYLYNPEKNIELGVAYLYILKTRWFNRVVEPSCQELCMIAAYNTGMGNVGKAFTGNTKLSSAIPQINSLDYKGLYGYLTSQLHEKEAREYVGKVTRNRVKYKGL